MLLKMTELPKTSAPFVTRRTPSSVLSLTNLSIYELEVISAASIASRPGATSKWYSTAGRGLRDVLPTTPSSTTRPCTAVSKRYVLQSASVLSVRNFEIPCAGLDVEMHARQIDGRTINDYANIMHYAIELLSDGPLLKDSESTRFRLQSIRFDETQLAIHIIVSFLDTNDGMQLTCRWLANHLTYSIAEILFADFSDAMSHLFISEAERAAMTVARWVQDPLAQAR